jgi:DHA2 family multidrug resistance protein
MQQFAGQVRQQTQVLALSDTYLAFIVVAAMLGLLTFVVAKRTYPPQSVMKQP